MSSVLYDAPGPRARRLSRLISLLVVLALIGVIGWSTFRLAEQGLFSAARWDIFQDPLVWLALLEALGTTLQLAAIAGVLAVALGIVFALLRMAGSRFVRVPATVVLEFFRGMPVLLMMFFVLVLFSTGQFVAVVAGLALYNGAIIGEALRSGFLALPKGQREAGLSIGLSALRTRLMIEFPQAFRNMLPIVIAQLVVLLKDTSLGYIVGLPELVRRQRLLAEYYGASQYAFSFFLITVLTFLVVNVSLSFFARWLAKRTSRRSAAAATPSLRP